VTPTCVVKGFAYQMAGQAGALKGQLGLGMQEGDDVALQAVRHEPGEFALDEDLISRFAGVI
jgi:hypothetical protein